LRQFWLKPYGIVALRESDLARVARIAANLDVVSMTKPRSRFWRGVRALSAGLGSRFGEERLHAFVRSLDAVVKTPPGRGRSEFIRRCSFFTGQRASVPTLLGELFDLRSAAEHLKGPETVLTMLDDKTLEIVGRQRALQAEALARFVYAHILNSESRTHDFRNDNFIEDFWKKPDDEIDSYWGESLDIRSVG
jgi:hypothetical protein